MRNFGATRQVASMTVATFDAVGLGDRSYLIGDGEVGVVVDPQRDPFPYLQEAEKLGIAITAVLETHIHNDYVSGGLALARATGATYAIPAGEPVSFPDELRALDDGDSFLAGSLEITAIATAGHTDHHLAYLVKLADTAKGGEGGGHVVCTGGSLLVNATGRTDLLGLPLAEDLARSQWRSVRRLLATLPTDTRVLPTHGFGSFCSATPTGGDVDAVATIGQQLARNPAALLDEEEFVATLLANLPPIPAYYRHMAPLNRKGPQAPSFEPVPVLDAAALEGAIRGPACVVDLRQRRVFAAAHLRGSLNLELAANLTTYLGWIVPFESELVLLAEDEAEIAEARRLIARIGRDDLSGAALWASAVPAPGGTAVAGGERLGSYPVASFSDLAGEWAEGGESSRLQVLDVRHPHEWRAGHLLGARHIPLQELAHRRSEVPATGQIWVHCGAGFRSAAAASLLSGWGASPVLIDDAWEHAAAAGLPIAKN
ncbi:MAG: MBL fold metallo-hydrolase [Acidimicrobiales bacterium]|jgi:glyoxylase-like metal-dependent hydrolase (beta-lactamase superfamily II)/rhodanese-related sulfurtransferase